MPDDNNTIPLINTIRETTLAAIAKKYKIETAQKRFDISHSQSDSEYITGAIDEYNDTIQDIIENIPDDPPPTPPGPSLPVVDHIGNTSVSNPPSNTSMVAYETLGLYFNGSRIPYDDAKKYAFSKVTASNGVVLTRTGFVAQKGSSSVWGYTDCVEAVNMTGATQSVVYYLDLYYASSNQAETSTVYNSSNVAYNAFKYNDGTTDYYYVLDEVQTDWTDDLRAIGYSLTLQNPNAYFTTQGSSASSDFTFRGGTITPVYDADGNAIPYDSSKTYTKVKVYNYAGQVVSDSLTNGLKFQNKSGYLVAVRNWATYDQTTQIYRVEYTVT